MWMQKTQKTHYVVSLFLWRFEVKFLPDFISNFVYTAILENHCIFILDGFTAQSNRPVFRNGHWILGRENGYYLAFLVFAAKRFSLSFLAAFMAQYR